MFRKLATCGVATVQLASSLKPQAAPFFFLLVSLLSLFLFKPVTSSTHLSHSSFTVPPPDFGILFGFLCLISFRQFPSDRRTYHKHARLRAYNNATTHKQTSPTCPPVKTHAHTHTDTHTLLHLLFFIAHGLDNEKEEKKIGKKNSLNVKRHTQSAM